MAMGKRQPKQGELFIPTDAIPEAPGHPFYRQLNALLADAGFDPFVEQLCLPCYAQDVGRPSIPPGTYFRMLFVGYFEGIDSQRGIAWRCADSRSLQQFLGYLPTEATPDHSSLTRLRKRLSETIHENVFAFVLKLADAHGLLHGKTVGVDSTFLEANAAMKSLTRRDTGDDYLTFLRKLAAEAGLEDPTDEELIRFDRKRKGKTMSNEDWESPTDPESKIAKMKDGTTHLAYKAEHVVDLETDLVLAAEIHEANQSDASTVVDSVQTAEINLARAGSESGIDEVVADKGYHRLDVLKELKDEGYRTYIPEPEQVHDHVWIGKPEGQEEAYRGNRRRTRGARSKRLQKRRSEKVERTFAHVCETGRGRRSWLRGVEDVSKRYLMQAAAHNLGIVMRKRFPVGTPRSLQGAGKALSPLRALQNVLKHAIALLKGVPRLAMLLG
jgi:transposase